MRGSSQIDLEVMMLHTETTPVEKALAWLHEQPVESMRACNDQQLQSFTDDLEFILGVVKPEIRQKVQQKFGLPETFGVVTSLDVSTFRRRLGLLRLLGCRVMPEPAKGRFTLSLNEFLS